MPTVAHTAHALRHRSWGRALVLLGVLVAAFLVSRSCQRSYVRITSQQAVAIGQREIGFHPEGHNIRLVQQGVPPRRYWAVSYWVRDPKLACEGGYRKLTVVLVNGNTGEVGPVFEKCK